MKKQCDKLFPGSKFVVLLYSDVNKDLCEELLSPGEDSINRQFEILYSDDFRKNLEKIGITVISTEELIGRKMDREEDRVPSSIDPNHPHPSASAWDEIVPALVKRLNL